MKGFSENKGNHMISPTQEKRKLKTKPVLSFVLVVAMIITMLPAMALPAWADTDPSPDYTITYDGSNFDVNSTGDYTTLAAALAHCTGTNPTIQFGDGSAPLTVISCSSMSTDNSLISGTYQGSVKFTVAVSGEVGLAIPSGVNATFNNLTVSNASTAVSPFTSVVVKEGATLNVESGTSITSNFNKPNDNNEEPTENAVVKNYGILNLNGGSIGGGTYTRTGISNFFTGTLNVKGGTVESPNSLSGIGIISSGALNVSGTGLVSGGHYGIDSMDAGTVNITGGKVQTESSSDFAAAIFSYTSVKVSGGLVTAAVRGIESEGDVTVSGGTVEATGSGEAYAILTRNGNVTVTGGTVQGTGTGFAAGILYNSTLAGGTISVSGGTVSSAGTSREDCGAIVLAQNGTTTVSGDAIVRGAKNGICFMMNDNHNNTINISGGTVESTDATTSSDAGAAVNVSGSALSSVTVTGGTLKSANDHTLKLSKNSSAAEKLAVFGLNIFRSSEADLSVKGVIDASDSNKRVLNSTNQTSATVTAANFDNGTDFDAWTSNSAGTSTITGAINGDTITNLSASSNTNVYLKTTELDVTAPSLTKGTATRTSNAAANVTFTSSEAGTYYYKIVPNNATAPTVSEKGYDSKGTTAAANTATTLTFSNLTAGAREIYIAVADANGNLSDTIKMDIGAFNVSLNGLGTAESPYLVGTAEQMELVGTGTYGLAAYYKLTADIDMTGKAWAPIGVYNKDDMTKGFAGTFDGDNHTISNLTMDNAVANFVGLFGANTGVIENLKLANVDITGGMGASGLCAANVGTITNCSVSGTIKVTSGFAGGIVAANLAGTVDKCYAVAAVTGPRIVGGCIGFVMGGSISECYANSTVLVEKDTAGAFAGAIASQTADVSVKDCYAKGTVSGKTATVTHLGGFVGTVSAEEKDKSIVENCYSNAVVGTGDTPQAFCGKNDGGTYRNCFYDSTTAVATQDTLDGVTGKTTADMKTASTFTGATWNLTDTWVIDATKNGGYPYLKNVVVPVDLPTLDNVTLAPGSVTGATKVNFATNSPTDTHGYAVLVNSVADDGCSFVGDVLPTGAVSYTSGANITTGVADGAYIHIYALDIAGKVIASYTNTLAENNMNIFAGGDGTSANPFQITTAEQLSKIGVYGNSQTPVSFILKNSLDLASYTQGWEPIIGFRGNFDGNGKTITNLTISKSGSNDVGLFSTLNGVTTVIKNLAITGANVTGNNNVGILAGTSKDIHVEQVYVAGTVTGNLRVGGLFGIFNLADDTILNCYSLANVSGSGMVGGLVGIIEGSSITNSYAAGTVSLVNGNANSVGSTGKKYEDFVGGLVGADNPYGYSGNTFTFNFYDSTVSNKTDSVGATGKSTTEMKTQTTFTNATWDFTNTWAIDASKNGGYPYLKNVPLVGALVALPHLDNVTLAPGSVTGSTKAVIADAPQGTVSYAVSVNNITSSGCTYIGDDLPSGAISYTSGVNITSGVAKDAYIHLFALDSAGKVIASYTDTICLNYINIFAGGDGSSQNPFQITTATQLSNLDKYSDMNNPYFFILQNDLNLGVAPYNIEKGWEPIKDFVGTFDGNGKTISNLMINRAANDDDPDVWIGLFSYIGNANHSDTVIKNLAITGADVKGKSTVGILAGLADNVHVEKIYVTGTVSGKREVGGLFGIFGVSPKTIINCYSLADVKGSGMVGGLVGMMMGSSITNSYAAGTVSLVNPDATPFNGEGTAPYSSFIGGLVGADNPYEYKNNTFTSNYYDKEKSGLTDSVGATGKTTAEMKTQSTFTGWDFTGTWAIAAGTNNGYPCFKTAVVPNTGNHSPSTPASTVVVVNGQAQDAGTSSTSTTGGQTVMTITVDSAKMDKLLERNGAAPTVTLPGGKGSDAVVGELNGQTVKNMENKAAILEIKTGSVTYTLPASQINIDSVSSQLGSQVALKDIKVSVSIAEPSADTARIVQDTANRNSYQLVVKPVEFEITCTSGSKTVDVSRFNGYVERTVAIPDGVDPSKITTGIVLNNDGTFRHVPTQIIKVDGKYYAKINSLTNSTYSVIYNPVEFADVSRARQRAASAMLP